MGMNSAPQMPQQSEEKVIPQENDPVTQYRKKISENFDKYERQEKEILTSYEESLRKRKTEISFLGDKTNEDPGDKILRHLMEGKNTDERHFEHLEDTIEATKGNLDRIELERKRLAVGYYDENLTEEQKREICTEHPELF
jgi:hypothetical protein